MDTDTEVQLQYVSITAKSYSELYNNVQSSRDKITHITTDTCTCYSRKSHLDDWYYYLEHSPHSGKEQCFVHLKMLIDMAYANGDQLTKSIIYWTPQKSNVFYYGGDEYFGYLKEPYNLCPSSNSLDYDVKVLQMRFSDDILERGVEYARNEGLSYSYIDYHNNTVNFGNPKTDDDDDTVIQYQWPCITEMTIVVLSLFTLLYTFLCSFLGIWFLMILIQSDCIFIPTHLNISDDYLYLSTPHNATLVEMPICDSITRPSSFSLAIASILIHVNWSLIISVTFYYALTKYCVIQ